MACYARWESSGLSHKRKFACGQCRGCRLEVSRQWAVRCVHEAALYKKNCYVTLTYNEESLESRSLIYPHFQKFVRAFRKKIGPVRFYMSGEYGENNLRPHFHALFFGYDFPDKVYLGKSPSGFTLYRSELLESLWKFGFSSVGAVTFESAAYVARYVMKKVNGPMAEEHYDGRVPEFSRMSLKPGIGAGWIKKFAGDVLPDGQVVINGRKPGLLVSIWISLRNLFRWR